MMPAVNLTYLFFVYGINLTGFTVALEQFLRHVLTACKDIDTVEAEILGLPEFIQVFHDLIVGAVDCRNSGFQSFIGRNGS